MKIAITGEKGFIAKNLIAEINNTENVFVSLQGRKLVDDFSDCKIDEGIYTHEDVSSNIDLCVYRNSEDFWVSLLDSKNIDIIVHNAAIVGTDVVAQNSIEATSTNVEGTYRICRAAMKLNIPIVYMGTSVIYDTQKYQDSAINGLSVKRPTTLYGCQKLAAEDLIKGLSDKWLITRPLFAYGGVGDMNSLPAKTFYGALNNVSSIDMFLNPDKVKDYIHVKDFCRGVLAAIDYCVVKGWNKEFNISAESPYNTFEIVKIMEEVSCLKLEDIIKWFPKTDYLGNHLLSSKKVRNLTGWEPKISLFDGLKMSFDDIKLSNDIDKNVYNPLKYLELAKQSSKNLEQFYPKCI